MEFISATNKATNKVVQVLEICTDTGIYYAIAHCKNGIELLDYDEFHTNYIENK